MSKRDAILKAAERLFAHDGFGLTSVDALAAEAGVTKRTLYAQFVSKEGLFEAWLRHRDVVTRAMLMKAVAAQSTTADGQLRALFKIMAHLASDTNFHGCPFSRALLEFGDASAASASRAIALEHKKALSDWFADRLHAAGVSNVAQATQEVALLYEGTLERVAATRSAEPARAALRALERLLAE